MVKARLLDRLNNVKNGEGLEKLPEEALKAIEKVANEI